MIDRSKKKWAFYFFSNLETEIKKQKSGFLAMRQHHINFVLHILLTYSYNQRKEKKQKVD